jgi:hypothetical protein
MLARSLVLSHDTVGPRQRKDSQISQDSHEKTINTLLAVADPDPNPDQDPPDPHVFGPPGSGSVSISQRYGSGSGSFHHHAKIVRKNLIPTVL